MIRQRVFRLGQRILHVPVGRALGETRELPAQSSAPGLDAVRNRRRTPSKTWGGKPWPEAGSPERA
jgi:hypothetical protein